MNEIPKILISQSAPIDPDDPGEYTNIVYERVKEQIKAGFEVDNYSNFDADKYVEFFYFGLEQALEYAYLNDIQIIVVPLVTFPSPDILDITRRYYPSVNVVHAACSASHIQCNILDIPSWITYVGAGQTQNEVGYNIDFWDVYDDIPTTYDPQRISGKVAGKIAWVMWQSGLSFWHCKQLCMRTTYGANVNIFHTPDQYFTHYTLEDGYGRIDPSKALYIYENNYHLFQPDPFLLYKLRSINMTEQPVLITSVLMPADISKNLFIGLDGALCGNGAKALGILNADSVSEEYGPVAVSGIALVWTGGAVTQGSKVQSNAAGKAITYSSGESNGYALDASTGADQLIRIRLS